MDSNLYPFFFFLSLLELCFPIWVSQKFLMIEQHLRQVIRNLVVAGAEQ